MSHPFAEAVPRLHDPAMSIVGRGGRDGSREDVVEVFAEHAYREQLTVSFDRGRSSGRPPELHSRTEQSGFSLRLVGPRISHFTSAPGLDEDRLVLAALQVLPTTSRDGGGGSRSRNAHEIPVPSSDLPPDAPDATSLDEKRELLRAAADAARSLAPDLDSLEVSFQGFVRRIAVWASDIQPATWSTVHSGLCVSAAGRGVSTHAVGGAPGGLGHFMLETPEAIARACIERLHAIERAAAASNLRGEMPVILEAGWGGVWLHETIGHLLEADVRSPLFERHIGMEIGSEHVTIVDDGTMPDGRGSAPYDDEGMPSRRTVLVEHGILRSFMTDRRRAMDRRLARTPNGRRQNFSTPPLPRMTNLILDNGTHPPEALVADVRHGLYVSMIGNGVVLPAEDRFHFDVMEGRRIENGRLTEPVSSLRLSGRPSDMLQRIRGVANDFRLDPARGACIKSGQTVPVSVGMPTVLIHRLDVAPPG